MKSIFQSKLRNHTGNRRRLNQRARRRPLRLESLERRRLLASMGGHSTVNEHHAADGVMVTETAVVTHHNSIPRFGANPTSTAISDGMWSDPAIWDVGEVPGIDEIVSIPTGVSVQYDLDSQIKLDVIEVSGQLHFSTQVDTSLWLNELMVLPSGTLTVGTEDDPVAAAVTAEIVFTDTPDENGHHFKTGTVSSPGVDPEQWGNGLIAFGTVDIFGQEMTSSYVRLAEEPLAGDTVLVLEEAPVGWAPGDELVLPDTQSNWARERVEELIVASVAGNRIALAQPLQYDHRGPRVVEAGQPQFLPHIGNLSRNVVLRSENPAGVRGHVAFVARADVDVRYARFQDLGRTTNGAIDNSTFDSDGQVDGIGENQESRYAMHFHHVIGPQNPEDTGFQFEVIGNAIDGALKWGVVLHGSHYGLIQNNILFDYQGAGFVTEDGTESYNVFEGNFAILSNTINDNFKAGTAGEGFWFRGPLTRAVNNVSANSQRAGFDYFLQNLHGLNQASWPKPAFRGADMTKSSDIIQYNVFRAPILGFEGNEVYASAAVLDNWLSLPKEKQYLSNITGWNIADNNLFGISSYANENLVIDGLRLTGDLSRLDPNLKQGYQPISRIGIQAVRQSVNLNIQNTEIRGVQTGFETPQRPSNEILISDSVFQAYIGVLVGTMTRAKNMGEEADYARLVIENTRFERMPENHVDPDQYSVYMDFTLAGDITKTNEVFLYDFNGVPGADYRVYYLEQAPNYIVPETSGRVIGSPEAGLSNAQAWENYGLAVGGAVAPSRDYDGDNGEAALARGRALGIHGLVFPLESDLDQNQPPAVNAGSDETVEQYRQIELAGQVIDDGRFTGALGGDAHVDWSKYRGPGEVSIADTGSAKTLVTFTEPGTYVMRLTASDGLRESYDEVSFIVGATSNRAPVVAAGTDLILDDSNIVMLAGTAMDDGNPSGTLLTEWSVVSGPGAVNFDDPTSLMTQAVFTSQGEYVLQLQANDGELVSNDLMTVQVNIALPVSPLLAHLQFDLGKATDSSEHQLHGVASDVLGREGKFGAALEFDGNAHVAMPRSDLLQPADGLTTAIWVRPSVADGVMRPILVWDGGSWDAYQINLSNGVGSARLIAGIATGGNKVVDITTDAFPMDQWTHVALTYSQENGGEMQLYRNGQLIGMDANIGGPIVYAPHSDKRLTLGKQHPESDDPGFIGALDDLYVYDYALLPAELADVMAGQGPFAESSMLSAEPIGTLRLAAPQSFAEQSQYQNADGRLWSAEDSLVFVDHEQLVSQRMSADAILEDAQLDQSRSSTEMAATLGSREQDIDATLAEDVSLQDWLADELASESFARRSSHSAI